ncbi:MAG: hypothetical protein ACLFP8_03635 [Alphaproteobacteria bacterium]
MAFSTVFLVGATTAYAQDYFSDKITAKEKAVLAFFRASGMPPDYDYWIKNSSRYESLPEYKQEEHFIREMLRLGHGYGLYDPEVDVLEVKARVIVKFTPSEDGKEKADLTFRFFGVDKDSTPSFDFPFGNKGIISLVVEGLEDFGHLSLSAEQEEAMRSKVPYEGSEFDANLIVHTQVYKADYNRPVAKKADMKKWLMVGRIAYLKCVIESMYESEAHTLWDYTAPWYEEQFRLKNTPLDAEYPHPYDLFK